MMSESICKVLRVRGRCSFTVGVRGGEWWKVGGGEVALIFPVAELVFEHGTSQSKEAGSI